MTVPNYRNTSSRHASQLLQRLNPHCANALEAAASLSQSRLADEITVEHWLLKLLETGDGDIPAIMNHYDLDIDAIWDALLKSIDHTPRNLRGRPGLSPELAIILHDAWFHASTRSRTGDPAVRSGNVLQAIVEAPHVLRATNAWQLLSVSTEQIECLLPRLGQKTCENQLDELETRPEQMATATETTAVEPTPEGKTTQAVKQHVEGDRYGSRARAHGSRIVAGGTAACTRCGRCH